MPDCGGRGVAGSGELADGCGASHRGWPSVGGHLCVVLVRADPDLGHDEFHQLRPWRIRHARHVCGADGRGLDRRRPGDLRHCRRGGARRAGRRDLLLAHPPRHPRPDAGADPFHLRPGAAAALYRVLDFFGEFRVAAAECDVRYRQSRRHLFADCATRRRSGRHHADSRAASSAHPHHGRQQAARSGRRPHRGDADGDTARPHAGAGLGPLRGRRRYRRRLDGDLLSVVAVGRRNFWPDRFCRGGARRFRQRARLALCRPDHRLDPERFGILAWRYLQRHRRLWPVRGAAVAAATRSHGEGVKSIFSPRRRIALLAVALLLFPVVFSGAFARDIGVAFLLAAISASAWNIVGGYAVQVSVGHSMFFGLGAYMPLLFYTLFGWSPIAGIPAGIALRIALANLLGMPTLRLSGHYFSMATIAVSELIRIFVSTWDFVGAAVGLQGPATARGWWDLTFRSELPYYYIFLAVLGIVLATTAFIERRRFGFYLRAIKASERAARSLGVPVRKTKMQALALSAAFTSVAGSLYAAKTGFIDPDSSFGILVSVQMVIVAALGGAGVLFGPLVGALILIPLQIATNTWFGGGGSGLTYILYGGIIVLIARFEPGGLFEMWYRIVPERWRRAYAA